MDCRRLQGRNFRGYFGPYGQGKTKSAAFSGFALQEHLPALLFDETLRDRQSQSRTFTGGACVSFNLTKFLEYQPLILGSDTYPCISHRYANAVFNFQAMDVDPATLGRELDCVAQQVVQDLLKADAVGENGRVCFHLLLDPDVLLHCQRTNCRENLREGFCDVKIFTVKFELSGFDLREIQNVVDQLQQM